jgi:hypothetical protein
MATPQGQSAGDADRRRGSAQFGWDREIREQQREDEDVVERERALDQVDGGPLVDRSACHADRGRHRESEGEPADAPGDCLVPARLATGREHAALEREAGHDCRRGGEGDCKVRGGPRSIR